MATDSDFADYIREQSAGAGDVRLKKMFGEYAVYVDDKVVALACDNRLFLKATPATATRMAAAPMAPPYPGAKPHAVIDEWLDDAEALARLLKDTADALPAPKPKVAKKRTPAPKKSTPPSSTKKSPPTR